jgi:hypothetical protein
MTLVEYNRMNLSQEEYEERKTFIEQLSMLVKSEYDHIYRILKTSGESYSENCNGIFFDVGILKQSTFAEMREYINKCINVRNSQDKRINEMNKYRDEIDGAGLKASPHLQ